MATYAIGDVQGCRDALARLLDLVAFDPAEDRLWFCGDIVNRGPDSLGTLRLVIGLDESIVSVMGNHDLHLLARAEGIRPPGPQDTMDDILAAPDRDHLLDWLARRPFVHAEEIPSQRPCPGTSDGDGLGVASDAGGRFLLVHAGLLPEWSIDEAVVLAEEATSALRADRVAFLRTIYGGEAPAKWSPDLKGDDRLRCIVAALLRLRSLTVDGGMDDDFTGPPPEMPEGNRAWFDLRAGRRENATILFGHWAALGLLQGGSFVGLDTGCVWGGCLTALRLDDCAVFQTPA